MSGDGGDWQSFDIKHAYGGVGGDRVGQGVRGAQHIRRSGFDGVGVAFAPSGDVADAVGAGVQAENPGDDVGDALDVSKPHIRDYAPRVDASIPQSVRPDSHAQH